MGAAKKSGKKKAGKKKVAKKVAKKKAGGKKKKAAKKPKKKKAKKVKRGSLRRVWSGTVDKSKGGLTKDKLTKNKHGKVVSKKSHAAGLKSYKRISGWVNAMMKARKELKLKGFVACKKGTAYYKAARKHYGK